MLQREFENLVATTNTNIEVAGVERRGDASYRSTIDYTSIDARGIARFQLFEVWNDFGIVVQSKFEKCCYVSPLH